jgi:cysteine desulfurase
MDMSPKREIYLDYSASTPVDPRVLDVMMPYFSEVYGNPSSSHRFGRKAEQVIEDARSRVAEVLNCKHTEIVFTSGGSESDNLAIRGAGWMAKKYNKPSRLITSPIEHSAVINTVQQMDDVMRFETDIVPVDRYGFIDIPAYRIACERGAAVASIIYANNEVGTVQNLAMLSMIAHENDILFHTDAVQAGGQLSLNVDAWGVDMLSLSAHKFYGPKGVGILYVKEGIELVSSQSGGSHERGRRAGTHNTPYIVGLAKALELAYAENEQRTTHYKQLRDMLIDGILNGLPSAELSGHPVQRLPSHASFILEGIDANVLLMHLDMNGIAGSSGSACKTGNPEPSNILLAVGYTPEQAKCGLRLSVGTHTTVDDIQYTVGVVVNAVEKLRKLS